MSSDVQETDTEPLLPHHELTIGASEISINDPDSKKQNLCSQVYTFVCIKLKSILSTKYFWKCVLLGQFISLLLCGTAVTSGLLSRKGVHTPTASNKVLGDIFCAGGAFLYGVSNVAEEFVVKNFDRTEFLAMLGLFGSLINGVQFAVFERHEVENVNFYSAEIVICFVGFTICQFALYTCMTIVIQQTSATTVNISLLTADFYTLLLGLFLFKYQFHGLYFGSFAVILLGVAIYATKEPERKKNEPEMTNKEPVTQ
ncbi:solute carrier family 35, member F1/2 [Mytilus galloprovincialis]|uniref:Solute carrier family 35, member F1/2 n=1 Tax=Mytilus galloprovincialis TaxID=29158 RepID=A0A8B6ERD0_MYTGA|nr:solute carrier family 35, member F1/2 [Mytilus galloprovincialis]